MRAMSGHHLFRHGFTLIEMLVVVSIIVLLISMLLPALSFKNARRTVCSNNLAQIQKATILYTVDYIRVLPPHRDLAINTGKDWFNLLEIYGNNANMSHCPELNSRQKDFGVSWSWGYDANNLGYGYNGFFLGLYSHPGGQNGQTVTSHYITSRQWMRITSAVEPDKLIVYGDSHPKSNGAGANYGVSLTLWWPFIHQFTEGVNDRRHKGVGCVVFADGHAEVIEDVANSIHPPFDGSPINIEYWDPLQRRP